MNLLRHDAIEEPRRQRDSGFVGHTDLAIFDDEPKVAVGKLSGMAREPDRPVYWFGIAHHETPGVPGVVCIRGHAVQQSRITNDMNLARVTISVPKLRQFRMRFGVLLAIMLLAGCAAGPPTASPSAEPSAESNNESVPSPLDSLDSQCVDLEGDGELGGDLTTTRLLASQGLIFVTFNLAANAQAADFGRVHLQVLSYGLDGNGGYIIGTQFARGEEIAAFVFENTESRQVNLSDGVLFADGEVAMRVPMDMVGDLSNGFEWRVTLTVDDVDVDECDWVTVEGPH